MKESIQNGRAPWQIVPVRGVSQGTYIDGRLVPARSIEDIAVAREIVGKTLHVVEVDTTKEAPAEVIDALGVTATQVVVISPTEKSS